jgi:hypothetical protein
MRGAAVERTLPVVGIGADQNGPAFVPGELEGDRRRKARFSPPASARSRALATL